MEPLLTLKKSINEIPYEQALISVSAIRASRLIRKTLPRKAQAKRTTMPLKRLTKGLTSKEAKELLKEFKELT